MEPDQELLVVYGTLRSGTGWREKLDVAHLVEPVGSCVVDGSLYDLGWYPGLVLDGHGPVLAEVVRLVDGAALDAFDRFEGFDPTRPDAGEYRRERTVVELGPDGPDVRAWVYVLARPPVGRERIEGGDWLAHVEGRGTDSRRVLG